MKKKVDYAIREWKLDLPMSRASLIQIGTSNHVKLKITYLLATEAILYSRGPGLEKSESYDHNRLIKWLVDNKQNLQPKLEDSPRIRGKKVNETS